MVYDSVVEFVSFHEFSWLWVDGDLLINGLCHGKLVG